MANIQPVTTWYKGAEHQASVFNCFLSYDNLIDTATIRYQLIELIVVSADEQTSQILINDELSINGADYQLWDAEVDANAWIYNWAANKLNLTII